MPDEFPFLVGANSGLPPMAPTGTQIAPTPVGQIDPMTGLMVKNRTTTTVPGYTPNYSQLIQGDPLLGQYRQDSAAADVSDVANLGGALQSQFIRFGEMPSGFNPGIEGLDLGGSRTEQLARQSTEQGLSALARMNKSHKDSLRVIADQLTGRGMLHSGEYGHQLNEEELGYKQNQYDARQALLDQVGEMIRGLTQSRQQRAGSLAEQLNAAFSRQLALPTGQARPEYSYDTVEYGSSQPPSYMLPPVLPSTPSFNAPAYQPPPPPPAPSAPSQQDNPLLEQLVALYGEGRRAEFRRLSATQRQQLLMGGRMH